MIVRALILLSLAARLTTQSLDYARLSVLTPTDTYVVVLGGIIFLLPVYGITNSERYSVFHGI